jgi:hypothetical protein
MDPDMRDYLITFHTFVVGFVASEFLVGWRDMLRPIDL